MVRHSFMCEAVCDLLSYLKIGYGRREKAVKPLEKLEYPTPTRIAQDKNVPVKGKVFTHTAMSNAKK